MEVRFTYRMETYVEGETFEDCVSKFEKMDLETENSTFIEMTSMEDADTYENLIDRYYETY